MELIGSRLWKVQGEVELQVELDPAAQTMSSDPGLGSFPNTGFVLRLHLETNWLQPFQTLHDSGLSLVGEKKITVPQKS
jgi:hypothetical protein